MASDKLVQYQTLSYTSKDFMQGVSPIQNGNNKYGGFFAATNSIDLFRWPGQIAPGPSGTAMANNGSAIADRAYTVKYIDGGTIGGWLMTAGHLYRILSNAIQSSPHAFSGATCSLAHSIIRAHHPTLGDGIFYFTDTDIGYWASSGTYYDNFGSTGPVAGTGTVSISSGTTTVTGVGTSFTSALIGLEIVIGSFISTITAVGSTTSLTVGSSPGSTLTTQPWSTITGYNPTGASNINSGVIHRACTLNTIIYFTNASFVNGNITIGTYDFTTGTGGTLNVDAFQLPQGYVASDMKSVNGAIEIYASNGYRAVVITWDGISPLATTITDIDDTTILAATTGDGIPYLITSGNTTGISVRQKNYYGYPQVQNIQEFGNVTSMTPSHVVAANGLLLIADGTRNYIYTYGTPYGDYSYRGTENTGTFPAIFQNLINAGSAVSCMDIFNGKLTVVTVNGGGSSVNTYPLTAYTTYNNSGSYFQTNFIDLPNDSTIEQIQIFIQPPTSTYAFTPQIYADMQGGSTAWIPTSGDDVKAGNIDANGYSKTYFGLGLICDNFAIGGIWSDSPDANGTIIIHRIDVTISTKQ